MPASEHIPMENPYQEALWWRGQAEAIESRAMGLESALADARREVKTWQDRAVLEAQRNLANGEARMEAERQRDKALAQVKEADRCREAAQVCCEDWEKRANAIQADADELRQAREAAEGRVEALANALREIKLKTPDELAWGIATRTLERRIDAGREHAERDRAMREALVSLLPSVRPRFATAGYPRDKLACRVCNEYWYEDEPEQHLPGCGLVLARAALSPDAGQHAERGAAK